MFVSGLSIGLTVALHETSNNIPSLRADVLDGLLEQLSQVLMGKAMPNKLATPQTSELPSGPVAITDTKLTVLALDTLGQFQFPRHSLQMFLKYIAHVRVYIFLKSSITTIIF